MCLDHRELGTSVVKETESDALKDEHGTSRAHKGQKRSRNGSLSTLLENWQAIGPRFWWDFFVKSTNYLPLVV